MSYLDTVARALTGDTRLVWRPRVDRGETGDSLWLWTNRRDEAVALAREYAADAFAAGAEVLLGAGSDPHDVARYFLHLTVRA